MLRRIALLTVLALTCVAVGACGDDDSATPTPSVTSNIPTVSGAPGFTLSITPTAVPGTPTPEPSISPWEISGQLTGTPDMGVFSCTPTPGYYQVLLRGEFEDTLLNIYLYTPNTGTLDFADAASAMTVSVQLGGAAGEDVNSLWYEMAGNREVQGTVVMGADGSGSMTDVLVQPSISAPGGATENVTISGDWTCPPINIG